MSSDNARNLYDYKPNKVLPIVAGVLFLIGSGITIWRTFKLKGWKYMLPWIIGGLLESFGYFLRKASVEKPTTDGGIGVYAVSSTFIVVAPALFAATLYMVYGRMIIQVDGGRHSIIPARVVTKLFVTFDVLSFITQASGGAMYASTSADSLKVGKYLMMTGLLMQIAAFTFFLFVSIIYKVRTNRNLHKFSKLLWILWVVGILILVRSVFRTVEFGEGNQTGDEETGYLLTHEVFFYSLETLPMLLCIALIDFYTPSSWIQQHHKQVEEEHEMMNGP